MWASNSCWSDWEVQVVRLDPVELVEKVAWVRDTVGDTVKDTIETRLQWAAIAVAHCEVSVWAG